MAKSYKVIVTPYAEGKLKDISIYLLKNASYEIASKVLNGILDSIDSLEKLPQAHPKELTICSEERIFRKILNSALGL